MHCAWIFRWMGRKRKKWEWEEDKRETLRALYCYYYCCYVD